MPVLSVGGVRVLYIHVPKTAGTSVETLLRSYGPISGKRLHPPFDGLPCSPQHFHAELLEHVYALDEDRGGRAHDFDFVFMTVRDPMARYLSECLYRTWYDHPVAQRLRDAVPRDYDRWTRRVMRRYRRDAYVLDNHLRPQHEFETFGAVPFRIEDGLAPLKDRLDDLLGLRGALPPAPVNRSRDRAVRLGADARQQVVELYREDFERYGYELPTP